MKPYLLIFVVFSILSGCASVEKKFSGERIANIGLFSEQTNALLNQYNAAQITNNAKHLDDVIKLDSPEVLEFKERARLINGLLDGIKNYSADIVAIAESGNDDRWQVERYHDLLAKYVPELATALGLPTSHFDNTLADIKSKANLLKAIRAAEPIIVGANQQMDNELPKVNAAASNVAQAAEARLSIQYKFLTDARAPLYAEQNEVLNAYIKELESNKAGTKMSANTRQRLNDLSTIQNLLTDDWQQYKNTQAAISALEQSVFTESQRIRYFMDVWTHAHKKMSSGVYKPAEWFDVNDLPGQLIRKVKL